MCGFVAFIDAVELPRAPNLPERTRNFLPIRPSRLACARHDRLSGLGARAPRPRFWAAGGENRAATDSSLVRHRKFPDFWQP